MSSVELRIADEFVEALAEVYSERVLAGIEMALNSLKLFPESGSPRVRQSLTARYGEGLRQLVVSRFVIVYRYRQNTVDVLALVYGPTIV